MVQCFDLSSTYGTYTYFPVVHMKTKGVALRRLVYSSAGKANVEYKPLPCQDGQRWNIDCRLDDIESNKSTISALQIACAAPNCYVTVPDLKHPVKGASLGLAVAAAVLGLPPFAYTGWVTGYGSDIGSTNVGPVDGIEYKIAHCAKIGMPLFVPAAALARCEDPSVQHKVATNRYYTFANYLRREPWDAAVHEAVMIVSFGEVIIIAWAIQYQMCVTAR
jgi:hypothetical protein